MPRNIFAEWVSVHCATLSESGRQNGGFQFKPHVPFGSMLQEPTAEHSSFSELDRSFSELAMCLGIQVGLGKVKQPS